MDKLPFSELGLTPELLKAVDKLGFEEASPIQSAVIPTILTGRDVVGQSSTGSGKTAAYAIPAIERIDAHSKAVQVLILCPTRELAVQVAEEVGKLSLFKRGIHVVPIYGGQSYDRQFRALESGVQIVIGTPGRVLDHLDRGTLRLDALRLLVLDEADRMLDMGFREDIEKVLAATPPARQTLFFSATLPRAIQDLIRRYARDPAWIKVESVAQNAPQVDQVYYEVDRRSKIEALTRLIDVHDFRYGIVFCSTKIMVDELDEHLHARGYAVDRLHGDLSQLQRDKVMEKFRRRGFEFLIATDVAARGLDVDELEVVFNYDLPNDAEDYTHRIGRTARAGKSGKAITFVSGRELYKLQGMVRFANLKIRRESIPSLDAVDEARLNAVFEKLRAVLDAGTFARRDPWIDRLLDQGYPSTDICSALIQMLQGSGAPVPPVAGKAPAGKPAAGKKPDHSAGSRPVLEAAGPAPGSAASDSGSQSPGGHAGSAPHRSPSPSPKSASGAPSWAARVAAPQAGGKPHAPRKPAGSHAAPSSAAAAAAAPKAPPADAYFPENGLDDPDRPQSSPKGKYERPSRTGREPGKTPVFFNVGRKQLVTPADLVGKIAGVTRLTGEIVGAIDIHQRHSLVDVDTEHVELVLQKLAGIRIRGEVLKPALGTAADNARD